MIKYTLSTRNSSIQNMESQNYHKSESISGRWVGGGFQKHKRRIFTVARYFARVLCDRVPSEIPVKILVFGGL